MSEYKDITIESEDNGGKIVFAEDVVATIATLAGLRLTISSTKEGLSRIAVGALGFGNTMPPFSL